MRKVCLSLAFFISLVCVPAIGKDIKQELSTSQKDRITITYEAVRDGDRLVVTFKDIRKKLGTINREEYNDLENVVAIFFDRQGPLSNYDFTGLPIVTLSVPESMHYDTESGDGYHILRPGQETSITLENLTAEASADEIEIPIFLAEYQKRGFFKKMAKKRSAFDLFAQSTEPLRISVSSATNGKVANGSIASVPRTEQQEIVVEEEGDAFTKGQEALLRLAKLPELLGSNDIDELENAAEEFDKLQYEGGIEDNVRSRLNSAKTQIRGRIDELKSIVQGKEENKKTALQNRAKEQMEKVNELLNEQEDVPFTEELQQAIDELKDIRAEASELGMTALTEKIDNTKQKAEEKKAEIKENASTKRTIWMIIGGIILAIALFIGNQVLQYFRSRRMLRDQQSMTNEITNRIKRNAEQKVSSTIRSNMSRVESNLRNKGRDMVKSNIDGLVKGSTKGKKNFKI